MKEKQADWAKKITKRFADREDIGKIALYDRFFSSEGLCKEDVMDCLNLIEEEYSFPVGFLRPEDHLAKLFETVKPDNIWQWLEYQVRAGDRQGELQIQLERRLRKFGIKSEWQKKIETIDDFVRAWCGKLPRV